MESFRKWFYKPKKDDSSLFAQFFYADEELNLVTSELDSFDGRKDPERCTLLVNHLRQCQDKVLNICSNIMNELIPNERAPRDFRVKFPDDVMQENLAGQLWFGAECLAAGSSIMNRETESTVMRPLAKALIKALETVRVLLREQCLRASASIQNNPFFTDKLLEALKYFDRLFAEFELRYVSAMVPVKSPREYHLQQMVVVLFSETLQRALHLGLLAQDLVDDYDPALMFTIPRLAIVSGLLLYPSGPICLDKAPTDMSEMFRPFRTLLIKIRTLLEALTRKELSSLEKMLCSSYEPSIEWNRVDEAEQHSSDGDVQDSASESSLGSDASPGHAATPPPTPQGFLIHNQVNQNSHASNECDAPVITARSLPDVDHAVSMNIVTEALSSLLTDKDLASPDSSLEHQSQKEPTVASSAAEEDNYEGSWDKLREGDVVSLDLPSRFVMAEEPSSNYRIRTSTRSPLQTFDKHPHSSVRRKRRKFVKTRSSSAVRVSVTLQIPSHSKRLSHGSSISSSCSSYGTADSYSLSDDSYHQDAPRRKQEARAPFSSSDDLIHRLFVCIAGVADQLQTNFAGDLRNILKCVFQMNASQSETEETKTRSSSPTSSGDSSRVESAEEAWETSRVDGSPDTESVTEDTSQDNPPTWVPDGMAPHCMTCGAVFTLVRRRHHCRNCGKIFCSRCSSNSVPLPRFGHLKPVRVCNRCFLCHVTPFMLDVRSGRST